MLNFILCDDAEKIVKDIRQFLEYIFQKNEIKAQITLASTNPYDVLNHMDLLTEKSNVYILDMDFKDVEINGLQLAQRIRSKDPHGYIIYITGHPELSMLTFKYKLKVFDYLVKPVSFKELLECIKALYKDYQMTKECSEIAESISIKSGARQFTIQPDQIVYLEALGQKVILHTVDNTIEYYGALKDMEDKLGPSFYRCHKSYLINKKHIKEINFKDKYVLMSTGDHCLISRNYKNGLKEYANTV